MRSSASRRRRMQKCEWGCGRMATHYCYGCGKWVCSHPLCVAKSALSALKRFVPVVLAVCLVILPANQAFAAQSVTIIGPGTYGTEDVEIAGAGGCALTTTAANCITTATFTAPTRFASYILRCVELLIETQGATAGAVKSTTQMCTGASCTPASPSVNGASTGACPASTQCGVVAFGSMQVSGGASVSVNTSDVLTAGTGTGVSGNPTLSCFFLPL